MKQVIKNNEFVSLVGLVKIDTTKRTYKTMFKHEIDRKFKEVIESMLNEEWGI